MMTLRLIGIVMRGLLLAACVALGSTILRNVTDALTIAVGHMPVGTASRNAAAPEHVNASAWRRSAPG